MPEYALNPAFVQSVKPARKPKRYRDGNGLYLLVRPAVRTTGKFWIQRITVHGRERELGLGTFENISLKQARQIALENRRIARAGGDPQASRPGRPPTFADALETVVGIHQPTWKGGAKLADTWRSSLVRHAFPLIGRITVDAITDADVMAVLVPIWTTKPHAARQVRRRIAAVMRWAIAQGHRTDNPAAHGIATALPKVPVRSCPQRALPYALVPDAITRVRTSGCSLSIRLAFEFQVLCAVRPSEARLARWDDIELQTATWTIPAAGMKAGEAHRVPLSDRAVAVLRHAVAIRYGDWVFPSPATGRPYGRDWLRQVIASLGIDAVPHGFRSSFRDWAAEQTNTPREVMEAALAHSIRSAVETAYARTDYLERRRRLMQDWAAYLGGAPRVAETPSH